MARAEEGQAGKDPQAAPRDDAGTRRHGARGEGPGRRRLVEPTCRPTRTTGHVEDGTIDTHDGDGRCNDDAQIGVFLFFCFRFLYVFRFIRNPL